MSQSCLARRDQHRLRRSNDIAEWAWVSGATGTSRTPVYDPHPSPTALGPEPVSGDSRGRDACGVALLMWRGGGCTPQPRKAARSPVAAALGERLRAPRVIFAWGEKRAHVPNPFYSYVTCDHMPAHTNRSLEATAVGDFTPIILQ